MNKREQAKKQAAVMLAYADGAEIESTLHWRNNNVWTTNTDPKWEFSICDYRVKQSGSDKVRSMLEQGKKVLAACSDSSQGSADTRAKDVTPTKMVLVTGCRNGVFETTTYSWGYVSPIDLSQFATMEDDSDE